MRRRFPNRTNNSLPSFRLTPVSFSGRHFSQHPSSVLLLLLQFVFSAALFPWLPIYSPSPILRHKTSPRGDVDSPLLSFSQQKSLSVSEVASDSPSLVYFGSGSESEGVCSVCVFSAITATIDGVMMAFKLALLFTETSSIDDGGRAGKNHRGTARSFIRLINEFLREVDERGTCKHKLGANGQVWIGWWQVMCCSSISVASNCPHFHR